MKKILAPFIIFGYCIGLIVTILFCLILSIFTIPFKYLSKLYFQYKFKMNKVKNE